jgi:succinyl-diaminopimelate desuccinylase
VREVTGLARAQHQRRHSDARFIKDYAKVAEFGWSARTMHKVNERAGTSEIETLTEVYRRILDAWFETPC